MASSALARFAQTRLRRRHWWRGRFLQLLLQRVEDSAPMRTASAIVSARWAYHEFLMSIDVGMGPPLTMFIIGVGSTRACTPPM